VGYRHAPKAIESVLTCSIARANQAQMHCRTDIVDRAVCVSRRRSDTSGAELPRRIESEIVDIDMHAQSEDGGTASEHTPSVRRRGDARHNTCERIHHCMSIRSLSRGIVDEIDAMTPLVPRSNETIVDTEQMSPRRQDAFQGMVTMTEKIVKKKKASGSIATRSASTTIHALNS